ncbi:hypothetical protein Gotri_023821 [Gossypium trilobum]|uniref:DUF4283 domain-containing protein n=1 Tax=Gossypium trilobum TaxID=34281 RepID=A0A7J9DL40_9ROSI|nr:hypothetical protein [Gossypium trilobum]
MVEDTNKLWEKLNFLEEEAIRVVSTKLGSNNPRVLKHGLGKIMSREKVNREAMYRVFKSLWFTKEDVNFVALEEGAILVKFDNMEDRKRQVAMDVGKAIGEVVDIDWRNRDGGWTEYIWLRVIIDVLIPL